MKAVMKESAPMTQTQSRRGHGPFSAWRAGREAAREHEKAIAGAIEQIIEGTDSRIRNVRAYQRKLGPAVERTLAFIDDLVASLPAPLELSRRSWQEIPYVNALFATAEDVRGTLTNSKELQNFFQREADVQQAYALLTATREEKTVLGMALQGDTVQRDVQQTSVSFVEHRILAPGATEARTREEVKKRALNLFVTRAQTRLLDLQVQRDGLERERQVMQIRLRLARTREQSLAAVEDGTTEIAALEKNLAENANARKVLGGTMATIDDYLEQVRTVFENPEAHLGRTTVSFRVNRMGIKLDEKATELGNDLTLLELSMGPVRRVVTLVHCPRKELLSIEQLMRQTNPYLASQLGINVSGSSSV